ncbi:hypothetical protein L596_016851 [Steinernema carpocapsae]|uniref:CCHC-type domain-containing protein n=1 Tax=Steinernema carpocapsae TaxID=34508 RepID=A0A4U5NJ50_STECR|nr:hypothetical protein L596_016851 [Steinernema carpocapsae]
MATSAIPLVSLNHRSKIASAVAQLEDYNNRWLTIIEKASPADRVTETELYEQECILPTSILVLIDQGKTALDALDEIIVATESDQGSTSSKSTRGPSRDASPSARVPPADVLAPAQRVATAAPPTVVAALASAPVPAVPNIFTPPPPKVSLKTFHGDKLEWNEFWQLFDFQIHSQLLPTIVKAQTLFGLLKDDAERAVKEVERICRQLDHSTDVDHRQIKQQFEAKWPDDILFNVYTNRPKAAPWTVTEMRHELDRIISLKEDLQSLCFNCLRRGHLPGTCPNPNLCRFCEGKHT